MQEVGQLPIERFINTANTILYSLVALVGVGFIAFWYMNKKGINPFKKKKKEVDISDAKKVDNTGFVKDIEFLEDNMIVCLNETVFVAAVQVHGINYGKATTMERNVFKHGMLEFLNSLDDDVQMYDQTSEIDVESNVKQIEKCRERLTKQAKELADQITSKKVEIAKEDDREIKIEMVSDLELLMRRYKNKLWQLEHNVELKKHAHQITKQEDITYRESFIICSYRYEEGTFSVERTKEEIYKMAKRKLNSKTDSIVRIFQDMKLRAIRVSEDKLGDIAYRHYNPIHADYYKYKQKKESAATNLYIRHDESDLDSLTKKEAI